jgi:hypothetical protein
MDRFKHRNILLSRQIFFSVARLARAATPRERERQIAPKKARYFFSEDHIKKQLIGY